MSTTGTKSAEEILGLEFDWLASDADGFVALFSTAGGGYAPDEFLRDTDAYDAAIDVVLGSPASTVARFAPELPPGLKNTWRMVAERGLFAFDSDPHGGPYRMVAAPAGYPDGTPSGEGVVRHDEHAGASPPRRTPGYACAWTRPPSRDVVIGRLSPECAHAFR